MARSYTAALAEFACSIDPASVPSDVVHEARRVLLDSVGCGLAGTTTDAGRIVAELMAGEHGPLEATIFRHGAASVAPVAFANTVLINALDHDAYGPEGHVAPSAVASALALGEATDAGWDDVLGGLIAGLEVGGRLRWLRLAGTGRSARNPMVPAGGALQTVPRPADPHSRDTGLTQAARGACAAHRRRRSYRNPYGQTDRFFGPGGA